MLSRFFAAALVSAAILSPSAKGQTQEPFFPSRVGTVLKYEDRDASGKVLTFSTDSLAGFTGDFSKGEALVMTTQEVKGDTVRISAKEHMIFDRGEVIVDMARMMQETLKETVRKSIAASGASEEDLKELDEVMGDMSVEGECRGIPSDLAAGMQLPDYSFEVKIMFVNTKVSCKDRKVLGTERLTTPAGTFDCFIVEENVNVKSMLMSEKSTVKTWYARGIGSVRQETWNKKKLQGVSELVELR